MTGKPIPQKLGQILIEKGLVTEEDLVEALSRQGNRERGWSGLGLASILVLMGVISRDEASEVLRKQTDGNKWISDIEHASKNLHAAVYYPNRWSRSKQ